MSKIGKCPVYKGDAQVMKMTLTEFHCNTFKPELYLDKCTQTAIQVQMFKPISELLTKVIFVKVPFLALVWTRMSWMKVDVS